MAAVESHLPLPRYDRAPVVFILVALSVLAVGLGFVIDPRQSVLFVVGGLMGLTLYHASFGFTGGWRRFVVERRGRAIRMQMMMIAVAAIAFLPLLSLGSIGGQALAGAFAPVGVSVLVGAALFGLGMQLGGACGSGTLFTVGGGSARMLVTLIFFIVGAVIGTAHLPWWLGQPALPAVNLGQVLGLPLALAVTLGGLALVVGLTVLIERRAHGTLEAVKPSAKSVRERLVFGPWPLWAAALVLAGLNVATLVIAGHPWSVTFGFGLWGAKLVQAAGVPVATWEFWTWPAPARALSESVLADTTSVMNFGIILGAGLAAGLAGKFAPKVHVPLKSFLSAAIGGVLMGYGARLSFGCNIGALFSGIASGSLHGWLWFVSAFAGSYVGIRFRPLFGLDGVKK